MAPGNHDAGAGLHQREGFSRASGHKDEVAPTHLRIGIVGIHEHSHRTAVRMRHPVVDDHVRAGNGRDNVEGGAIARSDHEALQPGFLEH